MKDLLSLALSATEKNVVKKTSKVTINDLIILVLGTDGKRSLSRVELVSEVSIKRLLKSKFDEKEVDEKMATKLMTEGNEEFLIHFNKINKTCKNGVDTSIANGHTNSNFSHNPKYKTLELRSKDGKYSIVTLKTK